MSPPTDAQRFRERALAEAGRYGSDPLVLVRELLQNARDAGASIVSFRTLSENGRVRLSCRDDGHGLTFDEAQRDLFTLYASRKRGCDAGRFGVGFWSVLLVDPARIVVRSWPRRGEPWEVEWDGTLAQGRRSRPSPGPVGTEVVLEWAGAPYASTKRNANDERADAASAAVFAAAWRHARFLRRRDGRAPLVVRVDGRGANATFELPAPSLAFRGRGLRGVVALGAEPRVELFAKGLLVRASASLDDLLSPGARGARGAAGPGLPGVCPQFLLDSDDLDLLLSRGDARSDDALARVVAAAREELDRLLDRQLARAGRRPLRLTGRRAAAAAAVLGAGVGLGAMMAPRTVPTSASAIAGGAAAPVVLSDASGSAAPASEPPRPYRDPRHHYAGPVLDPLDQEPRELELRYRPTSAVLHLAVLRITSFDAEGRPRIAREPSGPYEGPPCASDCVDVELRAAGSWTSLPVPTGHRVDPATVRVEGRPARVWATDGDEPLVRLPDQVVAVRYRTGPVVEPRREAPAAVALPAVLESGARAVRAAALFERPAAASRWVRSVVRDSRASEVAARFAEEARRGTDFARTATSLGAGDCDVQNGIVMRLLQASGVPARLAVGYLGLHGGAIPGLHAWVEHRSGSGAWRVEDASGIASRPPAPQVATAARLPLRSAPAPAEPGDSAWPLAAVVSGAIVLLGTVLSAGARRPRRSFRLAPSADVAGLVRGALRHPESVVRVPALLERALIPRLDGRRATLVEAQQRAGDARLFVARRDSPLARRAVREGGLVLDGGRSEARAVSDALGAVDLDEWTARLGAARSSPAVALVNRRLADAGERWRLHVAEGAGHPRILDLPRTREVVIDASTVWLAAAESAAASRPATSALAIAERVAELLAMPEARQAALLGPLAEDALREAAR